MKQSIVKQTTEWQGSRQRGFTLIEVMICALILSVGLLGVFELHIVAKRTTLESDNYLSAHALGWDIIERMKVNTEVLDSYVGTDYGVGTYDPIVDCTEGVCSSEEMVAWDLYEWDRDLRGTDSSIDGRIIGAPANRIGCVEVDGSKITVKVTWSGLDEFQVPAGSCGVIDSRLRTVQLDTQAFIRVEARECLRRSSRGECLEWSI